MTKPSGERVHQRNRPLESRLETAQSNVIRYANTGGIDIGASGGNNEKNRKTSPSASLAGQRLARHVPTRPRDRSAAG